MAQGLEERGFAQIVAQVLLDEVAALLLEAEIAAVARPDPAAFEGRAGG